MRNLLLALVIALAIATLLGGWKWGTRSRVDRVGDDQPVPYVWTGDGTGVTLYPSDPVPDGWTWTGGE